MSRTKTQRWRLFLLRWHRRFGVALAACLLWLAITGIALNHSADMTMDSRAVGWDWLRAWYAGGKPKLTSFTTGKHWISHSSGGYLYLDGQEKAYCSPPLVGAVEFDEMLVVACAESLVLLTSSGEVIERIDELYGLPIPLRAIASEGNRLLLLHDDNVWQANVKQITFNSLADGIENIVWAAPKKLPSEYATALKHELMGPGVNWERFVLDLHSGQFFGFKGRLLTDFFAFGLILLALSGVWVWTSKPGRWKKRS